MKSGIVRRIDELGRVVIPKEIRKTMRIREGEELEIFVDDDKNLVLKKYSPFAGLKEISEAFISAVQKTTDSDAVVFDTQKVVAATEKYRSALLGKEVSDELQKIISDRKKVVLRGSSCVFVADENFEATEQIICPINSMGELLGGVMFFRTDGILGGLDVKLCDFTADFFRCINVQ